MQIKKLVTILLSSLFFFGCTPDDPIFHDTDGHSIQRTQLKNKWIIVNYWATWCPSCIKEIPELNHFYKDNLDEQVLLYSVNYDRLSLAKLKIAIDKTAIAFPTLIENPNVAWRLGDISILPVTFIINPDGEVVRKILGPNTEESLSNTLHEIQVAYSHAHHEKI